MTTSTNQYGSETATALDELRELLPAGTEVGTILRHVSASGMTRAISPVVVIDGRIRDLTWLVVRAGIRKESRKYQGVVANGCGMDMGFDLVYSISRALYGKPGEFVCTGDDCRSNDHFNGDRDRSPHPHSDGGYALTQRWI